VQEGPSTQSAALDRGTDFAQEKLSQGQKQEGEWPEEAALEGSAKGRRDLSHEEIEAKDNKLRRRQ
jgi:hypothetical protein